MKPLDPTFWRRDRSGEFYSQHANKAARLVKRRTGLKVTSWILYVDGVECGEWPTLAEAKLGARDRTTFYRARGTITKKTPWTKRRLTAVINAVTAMLSGEEGEGDWDSSNKAEDLQAGLDRLIEERDQLGDAS